MRIVFFKTTKPKQFNYTPRYYDPDKEALKEREQQIKQEMGLTDGDDTPRVSLIKGQMRRQFEQNRRSRAKGKSTLRLIVIIAVLLLLVYFMIYY